MRRRATVLIATLYLSASAAAQPEFAPDAAELERLLAYFLDGASRNDIAVHQRFWAAELVYTSSSGERTDKATILAEMRKDPGAGGPGATYAAEDVRVQQYGDMAVVSFRLVGKTGAETRQYLNTGTFLKRDGEWRAIAWQATHAAPVPGKDAAVNLTPGATASATLVDEIRQADAEFFRAFFDSCDIDAVRRFVADDFEMIHDKGGVVATSGAGFVTLTQDKCKRQADGVDFLSARRLVPESLQVYPIRDDGAIEVGTHEFFAVKPGEPGRLTETGRFTHYWTKVGSQWKLSRVLSYDHALAE